MKVLLHVPLLGWNTAGCKKAGAHSLDEDLKEIDEIPDTLEVGWDAQSSAEFAPLVPGGRVLM